MKKKFIIAICLLALAAPIFVYAAPEVKSPPGFWPIVPCGLNAQPAGVAKDVWDYTQPCNQCLLISLFKSLIDFVVKGLVPVLGTFFFLLGGFMILAGADKPGRIGDGKKIMWSTAVGIVIILSSYLVTNFILKTLAADDDISTRWNVITCKVSTLKDITDATFPAPGGPEPAPTQKYSCKNNQCTPTTGGEYSSGTCDGKCQTAPPTGGNCSNPAQLASSNNEPYPRKNSPELDSLINCIKSKLPGENLGSQFTYDNSYELCNYTRGQKTCTSGCSHAVNSCHYGGKTGTAGSLAVDFGNQAIGQRIVNAAIACGVPSGKARCENAAGANVGCSSGSGANHVHVSAPSCDAN